jgi:hypothetical protein
MKRAALLASTALAVTGGIALAQEDHGPIEQLRVCSSMPQAERLQCLDRLARTVTGAIPAASERPAASKIPETSEIPEAHKEDRWIISQTASPVDYAPIATATTSSRGDANTSPMQLTIRCRSGRSEIAVAGPAVSGRGDDYAISYRINGGQPVQIAAAAPASGAGVAFKADASALIQSLPSEGELAVHLSPRAGASQDASFSLVGLERVRAKIAASCKWPHAIARPND